MGRASIALHLLQRVNAPKLSFYLNNILRKTQYTQGKVLYSLQALFVMLAQKKKDDPLMGVFSSLVNQEKPFQTVLRSVLLNTKKPYALIGQLLQGNDLPISKKVRSYYHVNEPWIMANLVKSVRKWVDRDMEDLAYDLAIDLFTYLYNVPDPVVFELAHVPENELELHLQKAFLMYRVHLLYYIRASLKDLMSADDSRMLSKYGLRPFAITTKLGVSDVYELLLRTRNIESLCLLLQRAENKLHNVGVKTKPVIDLRPVSLLSKSLSQKPS